MTALVGVRREGGTMEQSARMRVGCTRLNRAGGLKAI